MRGSAPGVWMGVLAAQAGAGAQPLQPLWARHFGGGASDYVHALAEDATGGVFVVGRTFGSLGIPIGPPDLYLARYDRAGERLWIEQFGSDHIDGAVGAGPDGVGGVFLAGFTRGNIGGSNQGGADAVLWRYSADGAPQWARQFGTGGDDWAGPVIPDGLGGAFMGGRTEGAPGGPGGYLARYSAAGDQIWFRQFTPSEGARVDGLAPDGTGGLYAAGSGCGPGCSGADVYVSRHDGAGNRIWVRFLGSSEADQVEAAAPDGAGGVFVGGFTFGSIAPGTPNMGNNDAFLARYDGAGVCLWVRQFGMGGNDTVHDAIPDGAGGVYIAGHTQAPFPAYGFVGRFNGAGDQTWNHQFIDSYDMATALALGSGGLFLGGTSFDGVGVSTGHDGFLTRYGPACYPDCNADGSLSVADFGCFQTRFVLGDPEADCNADGQRTVADFGCFQTAFVAGCP